MVTAMSSCKGKRRISSGRDGGARGGDSVGRGELTSGLMGPHSGSKREKKTSVAATSISACAVGSEGEGVSGCVGMRHTRGGRKGTHEEEVVLDVAAGDERPDVHLGRRHPARK